LADARQIVKIAREEATNYRSNFGSNIPLKYLTDRVSLYMHSHTLYGAIRPFGVSVILASYENDQPKLFAIEPSGVAFVIIFLNFLIFKKESITSLRKI